MMAPPLSCPMAIQTSSSPVTSVFQSPAMTQFWTSPLCQPLQPVTTCPLSEAPFPLSASTQVLPSPTISSVLVPPEQPTAKRSQPKKNRIRCDHCDMELNKKNLRVHIRRKHTTVKEAITLQRHLFCQVIDSKHGIFAVAKSFSAPSIPIHVQKKIWGVNDKVMCELDQCNANADFAQRSGLKPFECCHLMSLAFCPKDDGNAVNLKEETLNEMVKEKWFGESRRDACIERQCLANKDDVPLSVAITFAGPSTKKYISVYEPKMSYYCRLGRVTVVYDSKKITWACPCNKTKQSCIHKAIAKWHLFQSQRALFQKVKTTERIDSMQIPQQQSENVGDCSDHQYPPNDDGIERIVRYLMKNKSLPVDLPQNLVSGLQHGSEFRHQLIPEETFCSECEGNHVLSEPIIITSRAKILTFTGVVEGISTYYKVCSNCSMMYRYQEFTDGIHNFNDHLLLSLHLCVILRNALQNHTAVSRVMSILEATAKAKFPSKDTVLHAYLHFEALSSHVYSYTCINCGYYPKVVIMDLHKKGVFSIPFSEIATPPSDFKGDTNIVSFWESVTMEMIGRGFLSSGRKNPFVVCPSYDCWAPWIGPNTRKSDIVLNTEHAKLQKTKSCDVPDLDVTEERLGDELFNLKVDAVRKLCKECGLDTKGSRMDLVLRLRTEMQNRSAYDKIFQQIWGASGGWAVITCPCGIVYSIKFNIRAESPRDFADLLLSWKHFPNVVIYDFARGLAAHVNLRKADSLPFSPHEGRLAEPTTANIQLAKEGKLKVNLPWLKNKKEEEDINCHPLTGSSEHYALYDRFHEFNTKDPRDALRRIQVVPELCGWVNTQTAEQLFGSMRKNNYFLNMLTPSGHTFLMRNIIHHYNTAQNKNMEDSLRKIVSPSDQLTFNGYGQIVLGTPPQSLNDSERHTCDITQIDQVHCPSQGSVIDMTALRNVQPNRACWMHPQSSDQIKMIENALNEKESRQQFLAQVGATILNRSDFITLGHPNDVEGTILNACLSMVRDIADLKNIKVHCFSSYVTVTWLPPLCADPSANLPDHIAECDFILLPSWASNHWMICVSLFCLNYQFSLMQVTLRYFDITNSCIFQESFNRTSFTDHETKKQRDVFA
ncbi:uncharacterized protein LOC113044317 isoform X3 [Carassius auratus]|uniref:Uncharacterized protein LOC113044317 isoform X3 n=1 Tax=Carassius auratus TaxID=7957 RepID=A0A6P6JKE6_CARAU|nr:uncharacterized protein LOC113044317 isoform X3 [Carassius auratus]